MQRDAATPAEYLDLLNDKQRGMVETIRAAIFAAVPGIGERLARLIRERLD